MEIIKFLLFVASFFVSVVFPTPDGEDKTNIIPFLVSFILKLIGLMFVKESESLERYNKQKENGWFLDCDNTIHKNDRPILHTIAYTIDGLLDSAQHLSEKKFFDAAKIPAEKLLDIFLQYGTLAGRFNYDWSGSESTILTGCAQISICWLKIFRETNENKFFIGAEKMNSFLVAKQNRTMSGTINTKGAITGSYPVWGRYENFSCPNWATKYFVDALLLELSIKSAD